MAITAGIDPNTGQPKAVRLTAEGQLPVALADDGEGGLADLLRELIWEAREARRLSCADRHQTFKEYPGTGHK